MIYTLRCVIYSIHKLNLSKHKHWILNYNTFNCFYPLNGTVRDEVKIVLYAAIFLFNPYCICLLKCSNGQMVKTALTHVVNAHMFLNVDGDCQSG